MDKKRSKTEKIADALDRAREMGELGKIVGPDKTDRHIDRGLDAIDAAKTGIGLFHRIKSIFKRRK